MNSPTISAKLAIRLDIAQRIALAVGALATVLAVLGFFVNRTESFFAYLSSYMLFVGVALGSIGLLSLHHLVGGRWGFSIRRILEAASRTLWVMVILFVPIFLGREVLYDWVKHRPEGPHKALYLSVNFFFGRAVVYFIIWLVLISLLNFFSRRQDEKDDPILTRRMRLFSGPILVIYCLSVSAAAFDWVMSLTPDWYSSIYGMLFIVGQALSTLAFCTAVLMVLSRYEPFAHVIRRDDFHDLGNLLLTFVILWAYMAFSQYLIIWSGNLKDEITWYTLRTNWRPVAWILVLFHFAMPFALLLSRDVKRRARAIGFVAAAIFIMRWVDLMWLVEPTARVDSIWAHWVDLVMPLAIGGFWVAYFIHQLRAMPLLPVNAPEGTVEVHHG